MTINLGPLTSEELFSLQTAVVEKMINLNNKPLHGAESSITAREIDILSQLSDKISKQRTTR